MSFTFHQPQDLKRAGQELMGLPMPKAEDVLDRWESAVPEGLQGEDVFHALKDAMADTIDGDLSWADLRSDFWKIHTEAFQAWYLGDDTFISPPASHALQCRKPGFLSREVPLAPAAHILPSSARERARL